MHHDALVADYLLFIHHLDFVETYVRYRTSLCSCREHNYE